MPYQSIRSIRWISRIISTLLFSSLAVFVSGCSVFGIESVEEAPYQLIEKDNQFEIRDYAAIVVAQTEVDAKAQKPGNLAFRKLFAYISGDNLAQEKIAMTSPVISQSDEKGSNEKIAMTAPVTYQQEGNVWRYQFVLPQSYTLDTAPRPLNPEVSLAEIASKRVATVRYAGRATDEARLDQAAALATWMAEQNLAPQSEPRWAGYNSPWALPPFRRNEVLIDIAAP